MDRIDVTDVAALRLLAHPLRRRISEQLRHGPVSATSLAEALGESTGLTSYHLRQLAKHGFVEEVPELSAGKERWWRPVPADRRYPPYSRQTPEMREVSAEIVRDNLAEVVELYEEYEGKATDLGPWADAFVFSRASVQVDLEQFKEFFEDYLRLVERYSAPSPGDSRKTVLLRLFGFPQS